MMSRSEYAEPPGPAYDCEARMKEARFMYKCRMCGDKFWSKECCDVGAARLYILGHEKLVHVSSVPVAKVLAHDCHPRVTEHRYGPGPYESNERVGLADLIGYEIVETE